MLPLLLQTSPNPNNWLIYGVAGACGIYLAVRFLTKKKRKDPLADSPVRFGLSQQKQVERDMQNLLVELAEMSRQITAQLDTRSTKLELLIREADEKIAELRALSESAATGPRVVDSYKLPTSPTPSLLSNDDPRHRDVYQLADQGKSSPQIASELGRPNGEIELILALRGRKTN